MACEDEVLPSTGHVGVEAAVMHAVALHHLHCRPCVQHT